MREDELQLKRLAEGSCRFNDGIRCEDAWRKKCSGCGWNPRVQFQRARKRREDNGKDPV